VVGISGFILIGLSLVLSMQDFVIPRFEWEWTLLGRNALVVFAGLLAAIIGIVIIALLGPRIRLFDGLTLKAQITGTAGGPDPDSELGKAVMGNAVSAQEDEENFAALVGKIGTTDSILRPSGRAVFDGNVYTVEADGEFVESGRGIVVTRVRGNRIIVKRV
jgi:membrane-bound serine protease (ClpP class)